MPAESYSQRRRTISTEGPTSPAMLYSAEAEKAVLGCMMAQPAEVIDEVIISLISEDFFVPAHQEIFEALKGMHNNRVAIDVMTIHEWLKDRKLAEAVGSPTILAELLNGFATHLNVGSYIRIVKDKSLLRSLQLACSTIVQDIIDMPDSVPAVIDRAESSILAVCSPPSESVFETADVLACRVFDQITTQSREVSGIPSGFHKLDALTSGWKPGEMIVLAARPGVGKTALGMIFARNACSSRWEEATNSFVEPGIPVGVFSLEMPGTQLFYRFYSSEASISGSQLRKGITLPRDVDLLRGVRDNVRKWPLYIDDSSSLTLSQLRSKARRMKQKYGIELLVIDYLQLISSLSKQAKDNRQNEVAEISRGIKSLARELSIPIIILAQLNRRSEESKGEPGLHNLRESGAIEQDADTVLLLHRPDQKDEAPPPVIPYSLNIAKQRNGPTDRIELLLHSAYTRFEAPVRREPSQPAYREYQD